MGKEASLKQVVRLIELVVESGWSREEFQRRFIERFGLIRQIAEAVDELGEDQVRAMHPLFYKKKANFRDLLADCRQSQVSPDFNETNFPLEPVEPDEAEWEVCEYRFSEGVTGEAFHRLEEMGYRLCGPRRAMEFIATHPGLQHVRPLLVTARWENVSDGEWYVPIFFHKAGLGYMYLDLLRRGFNTFFGWLVLRRKAVA